MIVFCCRVKCIVQTLPELHVSKRRIHTEGLDRNLFAGEPMRQLLIDKIIGSNKAFICFAVNRKYRRLFVL